MAQRVVELALGCGIAHLAVGTVSLPAAGGEGRQVSLEVATPAARQFLEALLASPWFRIEECTVSTRELRSILCADQQHDITRPMSEPAIDVFQDLWQLSHITPSYWGRAVAASLLLAQGMFENSPVQIVLAALFLPFLSQILAASFGLWNKHWGLAQHGARALCISTLTAVAAGALLAWLEPLQLVYGGFRSVVAGACMAAVIGVTAGLCSADDAGRRYLIGVAAAVQCAVYPVWFGACLVDGFPGAAATAEKFAALAINFLAIGIAAACAYAFLGMKREEANSLNKQLRQ
jgi:hypothetical protein